MSNIRYTLITVVFTTIIVGGCVIDDLQTCDKNHPCENGAQCMNDVCHKEEQVPPDMTPISKECVTTIEYVVTDLQGMIIETGKITRNLDCCNSNSDCADSFYGRHCVAEPQNINEDFVGPPVGFTGFCQWCDPDTGLGCKRSETCSFGAENLLPNTGSNRIFAENNGGYGGAPSRSAFTCEEF